MAGKLADLLTFGTILQPQDKFIVTDYPGLEFPGNGSTAFTGLNASHVRKSRALDALNNTAAVTVANFIKAIRQGGFQSTSGAAVTATLPTAAQLAAAFGGVKGVSLEFAVDNSAGANTVTVAVATGVRHLEVLDERGLRYAVRTRVSDNLLIPHVVADGAPALGPGAPGQQGSPHRRDRCGARDLRYTRWRGPCAD